MKIFMPEYKHHMPPQMSNSGLAAWLVEVDKRDVQAVLDFWKSIGSDNENDDPYDYPRLKDAASIAVVCNHPFQHRTTLIPFLRRPYVTVYCGASEGFNPNFPHAKETENSEFEHISYEMGKKVANAGFNLRYGGGNRGLMGKVMRGFVDTVNVNPQPDQYSIQVIPGRFVRQDPSISGSRALNEGLCHDTDAAIITPSMPTRYLALSIAATAVFNLPGGDGSLAEMFGEKVLSKIGASDRPIYGINYVPKGSKHGYYDDLLKQDNRSQHYGLNRPNPHVSWLSSPQKAMEALLHKLQAEGKDPESIYRDNMRRWKETPTPGAQFVI